MYKYYWFTFADGYKVCARGFSSQELEIEEQKTRQVDIEGRCR